MVPEIDFTEYNRQRSENVCVCVCVCEHNLLLCTGLGVWSWWAYLSERYWRGTIWKGLTHESQGRSNFHKQDSQLRWLFLPGCLFLVEHCRIQEKTASSCEDSLQHWWTQYWKIPRGGGIDEEILSSQHYQFVGSQLCLQWRSSSHDTRVYALRRPSGLSCEAQVYCTDCFQLI